MATAKQLTAILENSSLAKAEQLRLAPRFRKTNRMRGEHLAGRGGSSTEFEDFRDYSPGDDTRYVDWNIFARLHRPYLKLYRHEEEMHIVLIIDASASMKFGEKFERARQLAALFAVMGLMNMEPVSIFALGSRNEATHQIKRLRGRTSFRKLFEFLENITPGGDAEIDYTIDAALRQHAGRGVVICLSDFLTFGRLDHAMSRLFGAGLEPWAIQLLSAEEYEPTLEQDARFVDSETGDTLDITAGGDLMGIYQQYRQALERELETVCRQRGGRALSFSSAQSVQQIMFETLRRKGWIR
ncbi:MAG: DUF58 domain-containing protein [Planctomyces sp.]|nr:DUF58 domain-containing protein [Planctomyces sp.]